MTANQNQLDPEKHPSDEIDEFQAEIDTGNFPDALRITSEAVTLLADRLNAVGLRIALIGSARSEPASSANLASYLNRLSSLVDSATAQMRFIQKLLNLLQRGAIEPRTPDENAPGTRSQEAKR